MRRASLSLAFALLLVACAPTSAPNLAPTALPTSSPQPLTPNPAPPKSAIRLGWAYEAYPETSYAQMAAEMTRMRDAGANSIWIGHNNPGEVDANKVEPGLSFAVWYALEYETGPRRAQAGAMADAVRRALSAARAVGLQVVLPIGYQIMMGATWNRAHPNSLRRAFDGKLLQIYSSPPTASPYDETYRADITRYYRWINDAWVMPYRDTIEMLSLSDEPQGGDYSDAAQAEFARRYGKTMRALGAEEQWQLGEFQAGVVADFAAWNARAWQNINPNVLTTISFHSEDARRLPGLPEVERLFAETPENFVITFDTFLHDDLPTKPATETEIAQLKLFLTTLGHYSKVYRKPLVLWAGANAWGLAQESVAPLGIADAATNLFLLYDLPTRVGGIVRGLYAWNYNVKQQGLYNFDRATTYDPRAMEVAVSHSFGALRARASKTVTATLQVAVVVAPRELYAALAREHSAELPPPWYDAATFAARLDNYRAAVVTPGAALDAARDAAIFMCATQRVYLDAAALDFLRERVGAGKIVMASESVARELEVPRQTWDAGWSRLPEGEGFLYVVEDEKKK